MLTLLCWKVVLLAYAYGSTVREGRVVGRGLRRYNARWKDELVKAMPVQFGGVWLAGLTMWILS